MDRAMMLAAVAAVVWCGCGESDDSFDAEAALAEVNYVDPQPGDLCVREAPRGAFCEGSCLDLLCRQSANDGSDPDRPPADVDYCRADDDPDGAICPARVIWWCDESIPVPEMSLEWYVGCGSAANPTPAWESERAISWWLENYADVPVPTSFDLE